MNNSLLAKLFSKRRIVSGLLTIDNGSSTACFLHLYGRSCLLECS